MSPSSSLNGNGSTTANKKASVPPMTTLPEEEDEVLSSYETLSTREQQRHKHQVGEVLFFQAFLFSSLFAYKLFFTLCVCVCVCVCACVCVSGWVLGFGTECCVCVSRSGFLKV